MIKIYPKLPGQTYRHIKLFSIHVFLRRGGGGR
jgi:hypothetical protein